MAIRLIIEISGRPRDAHALVAVISDYADEQFEVMTMERGHQMSLQSWVEKPTRKR